MIRIFARRPFVIIALFMCLGIFAMIKSLECNNFVVLIILISLLFVVTLFSFLSHLIKCNSDSLMSFFKFLNFNKFVLLFSLTLLVFGALFSFVKIYTFSKPIKLDNYAISGTIDKIKDGYASSIFYIKDVEVANEDSIQNLKGILKFKVKNFEDQAQIGDEVSFVGDVINREAISDGKLDYYTIKNNVRYEAKVISDFSIVSKEHMGITNTVRFHILDCLLTSMPDSLAYLSYSILFGDISYLSDFTDESFKISGVAHIVAVSGMNVAIIISLFLFLLKFMKGHRMTKFSIITFILVFYCILCDFTPSVVRATIMGLIVLLASFIGKQRDILSALGLACIIINLIWPLSIFDIGFLLSFISLIGIVLLGNPMNKFMHEKCHFPNFLSSSIAMTISAQIAIYPIMAGYFNQFSVYSLLANLIVVPVFSLTYVLLFATIMIVAIMPFMSFLLFIPAIFMSFVNWFPSLFVELPFASLYVSSLGVFSIFFYIFLVFMSKFIFLNHKIKIPINICLIISLIALFVLDIMPKKFNRDNAENLTLFDSSTVVTTMDNQKFLVGVGGVYDTNRILQQIQSFKIYSLDAVFIIDKSIDGYLQRENLENIRKSIKIKEIFVESSLYKDFETMEGLKISEIRPNTILRFGKNALYPFYSQNNLACITFDFEAQDYTFITNINSGDAMNVRKVVPYSSIIHCCDEKDYEFFGDYKSLSNKSIV